MKLRMRHFLELVIVSHFSWVAKWKTFLRSSKSDELSSIRACQLIAAQSMKVANGNKTFICCKSRGNIRPQRKGAPILAAQHQLMFRIMFGNVSYQHDQRELSHITLSECTMRMSLVFCTERAIAKAINEANAHPERAGSMSAYDLYLVFFKNRHLYRLVCSH